MAADLAPGMAPARQTWRRVLWTVFLLFTAGLIVHLAGSMDWAGAFAALRALSPGTLLAALAYGLACWRAEGREWHWRGLLRNRWISPACSTPCWSRRWRGSSPTCRAGWA